MINLTVDDVVVMLIAVFKDSLHFLFHYLWHTMVGSDAQAIAIASSIQMVLLVFF